MSQAKQAIRIQQSRVMGVGSVNQVHSTSNIGGQSVGKCGIGTRSSSKVLPSCCGGRQAHSLCSFEPVHHNNIAISCLYRGNLTEALRHILKAVDHTKQFEYSNVRRRRRKFRKANKPAPQPTPPHITAADLAAGVHGGATCCVPTMKGAAPSDAGAQSARKPRKKRGPKGYQGPAFRFDWLDCTPAFERMRQKRRADFYSSNRSGPRHCVMEGISTEFLCMRMVRIVPALELKECPLDCMNKAGNSMCACTSYGWAIWYNAGVIFQLVAEQLGDCGGSMLGRADECLLKAKSRLDFEFLPSVGASILSPLEHNGGCMTQWHMVLLQIWNNRACVCYEQSRLDDALLVARLIPKAIASAPKGSYHSIDWADENGDRWMATSRMTRSDDITCRRLLMNAQVMSRLRFASAA